LYKELEKISGDEGRAKDEVTFQDVCSAIQNGNKNFNMFYN